MISPRTIQECETRVFKALKVSLPSRRKVPQGTHLYHRRSQHAIVPVSCYTFLRARDTVYSPCAPILWQSMRVSRGRAPSSRHQQQQQQQAADPEVAAATAATAAAAPSSTITIITFFLPLGIVAALASLLVLLFPLATTVVASKLARAATPAAARPHNPSAAPALALSERRPPPSSFLGARGCCSSAGAQHETNVTILQTGCNRVTVVSILDWSSVTIFPSNATHKIPPRVRSPAQA